MMTSHNPIPHVTHARTHIREYEGEGGDARQVAEEVEPARPVGPEGGPLGGAELACVPFVLF